jgi:hypothetical protein
MLKGHIQLVATGGWVAIVAVIVSAGLLTGAQLTLSTAALVFVTCVAPLVVMRAIWRGAPPLTVAEILHREDQRP